MSHTLHTFDAFRNWPLAGDSATANWLPDEALAKAWKAKMGF